MFKTILVGTDGSDHADRAVAIAADLAEKYGARLLIASIVEYGPLSAELRGMARVEGMGSEPAAPASAIAGVPTWMKQALRRSSTRDSDQQVLESIAERVLDGATREAHKAGVAHVDTRLEHGDPAEHLLHLADREGADLIVIGSRGLGRLRGLLMGSVSSKIANHAPCTCITVR